VLILGGVALAAASVPASFPLLARETGNLANELLAMLADPDGAAEIGQRWIATAGHEREAKPLAAKIAKRLRTHGWRPGSTIEETRTALAMRIRHDFTHGETVDIEGWQMARTSVELCALAAARRAPDSMANHEPTPG
jgi:hypothetical protein